MIADRTFMMMLVGDTTGVRPGQFVMIEMPELFLRRPISVCDCHEGLLTLVYKVVGEGTQKMAEMTEGTTLNIITGLGNGYKIPPSSLFRGEDGCQQVLLVGGGVGVPPLFYQARVLRAQGVDVQVVLGFNSINEVFAVEDFKRLGCEVTVCTADGSLGIKGFVTDGLEVIRKCLSSNSSDSSDTSKSSKSSEDWSYYYACGPLPMLRALVKKIGTNGQVSMEERMGCGFGICVGCSLQTKNGIKRVCKEGPVFDAEEIIWEAPFPA